MRRLMLLAPLLLIAACSSAPTHFFTLQPSGTPGPFANGPALKPPIEVGEVPVPAVIDRNEVVLSGGEGRLVVSLQDQWGAPLGQLIRSVLTTDLTSRLPRGSVLAPGSVAPAGGLHVLNLNIVHFMGDTVGQVTLEVQWAVLVGGSSTVVRRGHVTVETRAGSGQVQAIVQAMSEALGKLADHLAESLVAK